MFRDTKRKVNHTIRCKHTSINDMHLAKDLLTNSQFHQRSDHQASPRSLSSAHVSTQSTKCSAQLFLITILFRISSILIQFDVQTMKVQGPWFNSQSPAKHSNKYFGTKKVTIILSTPILKDIFLWYSKNL
jgi:hypothetical protein